METSEPLISIILPAYNVEQYIRKSLDSICNQTYRNLEIIVVDDGSTDATGAICDEYADKDSRIRVLHCENNGVGIARNCALDCVTGEYIGFVDSDDWAEKNMFETLYRNLIDNNADISICSYFKGKEEQQVPICDDDKVVTMTNKEALTELIRDKTFKNYLWNKLFKRSLFDGIRFPEHKNFEDAAVIYRLFVKATNIACINKPLYHYVYRDGSIVNPYYYDARSAFHFFCVLAEQSHFLQQYDREIWELTQNRITKQGIQLIDRSFIDKATMGQNTDIVAKCKEEIALTDAQYLRMHLRIKRWIIINHLMFYSYLYILFRAIYKSPIKFKPAV